MNLTSNAKKVSLLAASIALASASATSHAYPLYSENGSELNLDIEAVVGTFSSNENYMGKTGNGSDWQEAYLKAGFSGSHQYNDTTTLYGGLNFVSSGSWGDGDAAGNTDGSERRTAVEDAYLGIRSGIIDVSAGRQNITIGDGFLINGDALNVGKGTGVPGFAESRGGAYWLAGRKAFDETFWVKIGGEQGFRSDLFWFKSDNLMQDNAEMAGINVEYTNDIGTFGVMHLKGLDGNQIATDRKGQITNSIRYQGNAGVDNLFLSAELVNQESGSGVDADAWYAEAGWTFADIAWSPQLSYRYTKYDDTFDSLFFGFNRGYGTWFQGEVAANYAGPFGSSTTIQHVALKASPTEMLSVGALYFDFSDSTTFGSNSEGQEFDVYAEWVVNDHLIISPLIGLYSPDSNNTTQTSSNDDNLYAQVIAIVPF